MIHSNHKIKIWLYELKNQVHTQFYTDKSELLTTDYIRSLCEYRQEKDF